MVAYLLLRNNKQTGPYSLEELKSFGIKATDLIWIEGRSSAWLFPDEIEELQELVHASPINNRYQANAIADSKQQESNGDDFLFEKKEKSEILQFKKKFKPTLRNADEEDQMSRRSIELRKSIFSKTDTDFSFGKEYFNDDQQNILRNLPDAIRVIIADDHRLFREGVKTALAQKNDVKIIGEAENGMQLLNILKYNKPDVILLDIQMPVMDGISALASIRKIYADMKVIVLSMHEGHSMVSTLMETGANGYLTKTADPETIYQAIKTCFEKNYYFNELTNISMLEELRSKKKIPEKIHQVSFDGREMMQRLTEAQKKSGHFYSTNSNTKVLIAACAALLIGAGVIAGMNLLGNSAKPVEPSVPIKVADASNPVTENQSAATTAPVQQIDSAKPGLENPLENNIDDEIGLAEKNIQQAERRKMNQEKLPVRKTENSLAKQAATVIQQTDLSSSNANQNTAAKQTVAVLSDAKSIARDAIRNLVDASANEYHVGTFGGLSGIEITVSNHSHYLIDEAVVEVKYFLSNSKLYKTETLNFQNIQPLSSQMLKAPKSPRGETLQYKIISLKSKELDL